MLTLASVTSPTNGHIENEPVVTEPIAAHGNAPVQQRKGSIFAARGHEKDTFAALTENVTGEFVLPTI
jgi:hypothetical protein